MSLIFVILRVNYSRNQSERTQSTKTDIGFFLEGANGLTTGTPVQITFFIVLIFTNDIFMFDLLATDFRLYRLKRVLLLIKQVSFLVPKTIRTLIQSTSSGYQRLLTLISNHNQFEQVVMPALTVVL